MYSVPYWVHKFWPVACTTMLVPITIRVRLRLTVGKPRQYQSGNSCFEDSHSQGVTICILTFLEDLNESSLLYREIDGAL